MQNTQTNIAKPEFISAFILAQMTGKELSLGGFKEFLDSYTMGFEIKGESYSNFIMLFLMDYLESNVMVYWQLQKDDAPWLVRRIEKVQKEMDKEKRFEGKVILKYQKESLIFWLEYILHSYGVNIIEFNFEDAQRVYRDYRFSREFSMAA